VSFTQPELQLVHLLSVRFDVPELRRVLGYLPNQGQLAAHLLATTDTSKAAFVLQAVRALMARGLVGPPLFDLLASERPALAGEIWGVAALFGCHHPDAAPLLPLHEALGVQTEPPAELRMFVGRSEQLSLLRTVLLPVFGPVCPAFVCNLQGMAGVGKSFLVERFYADHIESFPGGHQKIVIGYDESPTDEGLLLDLAERLGVLQGAGRVADRVRGSALSFRPLIHIDNVDTESQALAASALVRSLPGVPIVLSGRYQFGKATSCWRIVPVEPFTLTEAQAQLTAELLPSIAARVPTSARTTLIGALGGLPLAIHLAASYLNIGYAVDDFLHELNKSGLSMTPFTASDTAYVDRTQRALCSTFELSLSALCNELGAEAEEGLRGIAALSVAPLSGVGRSWLEAIVGASAGKAIRWVSLAVKLSIVQYDDRTGRWQVHKLLGELLRRQLNVQEEAANSSDYSTSKVQQVGALGGSPLRSSPLGGSHSQTRLSRTFIVGSGAGVVPLDKTFCMSSSTSAELDGVSKAIHRMDEWVLTRLPRQPDETRGERWKALQAEYEGLSEWVAGLEGPRAVHGGAAGFDYALLRGPYTPWLGAVARGIAATTIVSTRSNLLWLQGNLAQRAGDRDLALRSAENMAELGYTQGWERQVALAAGLRAEVLQSQGNLDHAMRIHKEEVLPVYERLGSVYGRAITLARIAGILHMQGRLDEALQIHQEEVLPAYERLGAERERAATMSRIADILQAQGELDEALRIRTEEELPVYERTGDDRAKAVTLTRIAAMSDATRGASNAQPRSERPDHAKKMWTKDWPINSDKATGAARASHRLYDLDVNQSPIPEEALPLGERLGDVYGKAATMSQIASILRAKGQLEAAVQIYREEVLPVLARLGDTRGEAITMGDIADILQAQGHIDEALQVRRDKELPIFEQLGDLFGKAVTLSRIGDILQARGQLDDALQIRLEEELPVFVRVGDLRSQAVTLNKIADIFHRQGNCRESLRIRLDEVVALYGQLNDERQRANTLGKVAELLVEQGEQDEAVRIWQEEVLPVLRRLGDRREELLILRKVEDVLNVQDQLENLEPIERTRVAYKIRFPEHIDDANLSQLYLIAGDVQLENLEQIERPRVRYSIGPPEYLDGDFPSEPKQVAGNDQLENLEQIERSRVLYRKRRTEYLEGYSRSEPKQAAEKVERDSLPQKVRGTMRRLLRWLLSFRGKAGR